MTGHELVQAFAAVLAAGGAFAAVVVLLIPREPIAPGMFGDDGRVVALDTSPLPLWRPPLMLGDPDALSDAAHEAWEARNAAVEDAQAAGHPTDLSTWFDHASPSGSAALDAFLADVFGATAYPTTPPARETDQP